MPTKTDYLYLVLVAALAVTFGICVGPYWTVDACVLALVSCVVVYVGIRVSGSSVEHEGFFFPLFRFTKKSSSDSVPSVDSGIRDYIPRSRIAHYARISRMRSDDLAARVANNPFEQALLREQDWRTLSAEELKKVGESIRKSWRKPLVRA